MDSMSYRNSRPPQRSSAPEQREEPPKKNKEEVSAEQPVAPVPASRRQPEPIQGKKSGKKPLFIIGLIVLVVAVIALIFSVVTAQGGPAGDTGIDDKKYQAVFFTNGQVYFGKLTIQSDDALKLTDIFYLQTQADGQSDSENPQTAATNSQSDVQLIKLGDEVHGPDDMMIINRDQVLFYENLKADGKVSQSIAKFNSNR